MSRLSAAPLIEAIVELRWGAVRQDENTIQFNLSPEEANFFPGQFRTVAISHGFSNVETLNDGMPMPQIINYRFRKAPDVWPCYQTGFGIFTVNQLNDGYDWKTFREDVLQGFRMLDNGHPNGLAGLNTNHIELRYQDGFLLEDGETPTNFMQNKMNFGFNVTPDFLKSSNVGDLVQGYNVSFQVETHKPAGVLIFVLREGKINGKPGFIMDTVMRSKEKRMDIQSIDAWLDEAHSTQKHAFETLIDPTYMKSFK